MNICAKKLKFVVKVVNNVLMNISDNTFRFWKLLLLQIPSPLQVMLQPSAKEILESVRALFLQVRIITRITNYK